MAEWACRAPAVDAADAASHLVSPHPGGRHHASWPEDECLVCCKGGTGHDKGLGGSGTR